MPPALSLGALKCEFRVESILNAIESNWIGSDRIGTDQSRLFDLFSPVSHSSVYQVPNNVQTNWMKTAHTHTKSITIQVNTAKEGKRKRTTTKVFYLHGNLS